MAHRNHAPRCVATVRCSRAELPRPFRASARACLCPGQSTQVHAGRRPRTGPGGERSRTGISARPSRQRCHKDDRAGPGLSNAKVGALVVAPVDPPSIAPHLRELIWSGAYVGTIVPPPATSLLNAPQYMTGRVLAEEAADSSGRVSGQGPDRAAHA